MPDLLALEEVTAGYRDVPAVRHVSLGVGAGEVVGVIGPNGSGKTTLVRVACRALRPWTGRASVAGRDVRELPAREVARLVAVVPQETPATFSFSALEVVLMGRSPYLSPWGGGTGEDFRRVRAAMEAAGVQGLADRPIDQLSGGEKQRVILAQALAQDAPLLLLDEPTTHLDPGHVVSILDAVRRLARGGRGVLAVFHDLNLAAATCDRLIALDRGRVVADGRADDVVTPDLVRSLYAVEAEVGTSAATGRPTVLLTPSREPAPARTRPRVHVVGGAGRGAAVIRALAEAGHEVTVGVLHGGDTDEAVAERLNLERVSVPPFSPVGEPEEREVLALMRGASAIVVCDAPYGPGNVGNLRAVRRALDGGARVILMEGAPIDDRDFTGGEAGELWRSLEANAQVVRSSEEAAKLVFG